MISAVDTIVGIFRIDKLDVSEREVADLLSRSPSVKRINKKEKKKDQLFIRRKQENVFVRKSEQSGQSKLSGPPVEICRRPSYTLPCR